jgi:hypothetical protein
MKEGPAIFTDAQGRPIPKPKRADFATDAAYVGAVHAFHNRLASEASAAVYHRPSKVSKIVRGA